MQIQRGIAITAGIPWRMPVFYFAGITMHIFQQGDFNTYEQR